GGTGGEPPREGVESGLCAVVRGAVQPREVPDGPARAGHARPLRGGHEDDVLPRPEGAVRRRLGPCRLSAGPAIAGDHPSCSLHRTNPDTKKRRSTGMTTERQREANRRNAALSTGPRSREGKAIVSRNSIRHGAFSTAPVIPGVESQKEWEAHRTGVLQSLAPEGVLELRLAERVAMLLWRMDRVGRFESAFITVTMAEAAEPPKRDDAS